MLPWAVRSARACVLVIVLVTLGAAFAPGASAEPLRFGHYDRNPVLKGKNLYAPNVLKVGGGWFVYYGGWREPGDVHDRIYLARTGNLTGAYDAPPGAIVGNGEYEHVNDPSVARRDADWVMALTTARKEGPGLHDLCSLLHSGNGEQWEQVRGRQTEIKFQGAEVRNCARPSLIWNGDARRWELYFDGIVGGSNQVQQHLAVSTDIASRTFTYQAQIGPWADADIQRVDGRYFAAFRRIDDPDRVWKISYATSNDGRSFTPPSPLLAPDPRPGQEYDDCGVTNPGWAVEGGRIVALLYGGTQSCSYDNHKIGVAVRLASA